MNMTTTRTPLHRAARCMVLAALLGGTAAAYAQTVNITETFRNSSAQNWNLMGDAVLTSGGLDPAGDGWLRLTPAETNKKSSAIYNQAFSSTDGVDIEFSYATYGGTGADGISFYLIDGSTATPTVGAGGGGLGYAHHAGQPGVTNGYVGLGLDEWGNFVNTTTGTCTLGHCDAGLINNRVGVRGSGSLSTGFELLHKSPMTIATGNRAGAKRVRVMITPGPDVKLSAWVDGTAVVTDLALSTGGTAAPGMGALPATFKMGFSGSTGAATNVHEIRNLTVRQARLKATNDVYAATPGTPLTVNAANGLGSNDTGVLPTGSFTVLNAPPASAGTLALNADGSFTFTPAASFTGSTTATYQVCNPPGGAANCSTATVTFNVVPAPTAVNDTVTTAMDTPARGNVGSNDTMPAGSTFSVVTPPPASEGTLTFNPDGSYVFTPATGFTGTSTFTYQVCSGPGHTAPCSTATATVTVTPKATDDTVRAAPGATVNGDVSTNDNAPAGSTYSPVASTLPNPTTQGTLTFNPDGTFSFVPVAGFTGVVSFQYQVCPPAGTPCATATVQMLIGTAIGTTAVPTLSHWSLMLMGLAAAGMGARRLRRKA